jgi:GntR family transcriptional regulator
MILVVDPHSGVPVYRQLMDQVRFQVASGQLRAGDEIPSTRALSAQLGVNFMTVSKAFRLLEEEGVLERRPGLASVVRAQKGRKLRASKFERLRSSLRPVATRARQLGLSTEESLGVFRELLDEQED